MDIGEKGQPREGKSGAKLWRKVKSPRPGEVRALTDCVASLSTASGLPSNQQELSLS